jgi:hypothetical protein
MAPFEQAFDYDPVMVDKLGYVPYEPWAPSECSRGHPFGPGRVKVGHVICGCEGGAETGGHLTYTCRQPDCGDEILVGHTGPAPEPERMPDGFLRHGPT